MGFFDLFKRKDKKQEEIDEKIDNEPKLPFERKGDLQTGLTIDYDEPSFKKMYDAVCLRVRDTKPCMVENGLNVYNAYVSWYGKSDCQIVGIPPRRDEVKEIQIGLDPSKLEKGKEDLEYMKILFTQLLDQNRVNRYLEKGLQENPDIPCGNYIGEVFYDTNSNTYRKEFKSSIGMESHFSEQQIERREEHKRKIEEAKKAKIAEKEAEIKKLQSDIEKLGER